MSGAQVPNATSEIFPTFTPSGIPACTVVPLSYGGSGAVNVPAAGAVTLSSPTSSSLGATVTTINMGAGATLATSESVTIYVTGSVSTGDNVTFGSPTGTPLRMVTKSDGDSTNSSSFQTGQNFFTCTAASTAGTLISISGRGTHKSTARLSAGGSGHGMRNSTTTRSWPTRGFATTQNSPFAAGPGER